MWCGIDIRNGAGEIKFLVHKSPYIVPDFIKTLTPHPPKVD